MATQAPKTRKTRWSEWLLGRFLYLRFLIVKRGTNFRITKTDLHWALRTTQCNCTKDSRFFCPLPARRTLPVSTKPKTIRPARMRTAENMQNLIKTNRQFVFRPSFSLLWFLVLNSVRLHFCARTWLRAQCTCWCCRFAPKLSIFYSILMR